MPEHHILLNLFDEPQLLSFQPQLRVSQLEGQPDRNEFHGGWDDAFYINYV